MRVKINGQEATFRTDKLTASMLEQHAPAPGMMPVVNGRVLSPEAMQQPLRENSIVEYAAKGVVKAQLGTPEQRLVLQDLEDANRYFVDLYGPEGEFDIDFDAEEEYLIINNFKLPSGQGFKCPVMPLLIPLSGFPMSPPPGLHVPNKHPDTPRLAKAYSLFKNSPPPYSRTHNLTSQGWAWLCLRKKAGGGDEWNWKYRYTTQGPDSIKDLLVLFDAFNREG